MRTALLETLPYPAAATPDGTAKASFLGLAGRHSPAMEGAAIGGTGRPTFHQTATPAGNTIAVDLQAPPDNHLKT